MDKKAPVDVQMAVPEGEAAIAIETTAEELVATSSEQLVTKEMVVSGNNVSVSSLLLSMDQEPHGTEVCSFVTLSCVPACESPEPSPV